MTPSCRTTTLTQSIRELARALDDDTRTPHLIEPLMGGFRIREVLFVVTANFRFNNHAFILLPRIAAKTASLWATRKSCSSLATWTCRRLTLPVLLDTLAAQREGVGASHLRRASTNAVLPMLASPVTNTRC